MYLLHSSKNNFVIAFSIGAIMNVTASLLMGIYITFDLLVSELMLVNLITGYLKQVDL